MGTPPSTPRAKPLGPPCACDSLFQGFSWRLLTELDCDHLPQAPGVYVLRVVKLGDVDAASALLRDIITRARWGEVGRFFESRLRRLGRLRSSSCPVVYIGSTRSLGSRCRDLVGRRHTAFVPVLALLVSGTVLDYGYRVFGSEGEARTFEAELKSRYVAVHGVAPALVER